jgi:hypothetical protein
MRRDLLQIAVALIDYLVLVFSPSNFKNTFRMTKKPPRNESMKNFQQKKSGGHDDPGRLHE